MQDPEREALVAAAGSRRGTRHMLGFQLSFGALERSSSDLNELRAQAVARMRMHLPRYPVDCAGQDALKGA